MKKNRLFLTLRLHAKKKLIFFIRYLGLKMQSCRVCTLFINFLARKQMLNCLYTWFLHTGPSAAARVLAQAQAHARAQAEASGLDPNAIPYFSEDSDEDNYWCARFLDRVCLKIKIVERLRVYVLLKNWHTSTADAQKQVCPSPHNNTLDDRLQRYYKKLRAEL